MTGNEIRRLFATLILAGRALVDRILHWSQWRRRRQAQARAAHYRKRLKHAESNEPG